MSAFLRKRITRVVVPLVFWSIVGWGLESMSIPNDENAVLWYMYSISGLYLLTPVLRRWMDVARIREVEFYLLIWVVTLCVPIVEMFRHVDEGDTSWLYYFHGYVGYYVLGGYLDKYYGKNESLLYRWRKRLILPLFIVVSLVFPAAMRLLDVEVDFYRVFWYLGVSVMMMCVVWWIVWRHVCAKVKEMPKWIASVSSLTYGVYLTHILVMRNVLWRMDWMIALPGAAQIAVCTLLTFVLSLVASYGLSKVRFLRMSIGM